MSRYTYLGRTAAGHLLASSQKWNTKEEAEAAAHRHATEKGTTITSLEILTEKQLKAMPIQAAP